MTDRDMIVGGFRIPKNTPVQLPTYSMHLSNANFVQPLRFWPERWTQQISSSPLDTGMLHIAGFVVLSCTLFSYAHDLAHDPKHKFLATCAAG